MKMKYFQKVDALYFVVLLVVLYALVVVAATRPAC
jgi:hypothetical protein